MFRRGETPRERSLLRQVEALERRNLELIDRLMYVVGRPYTAPVVVEDDDGEEPVVYHGALDVLPEDWES